MKNNFGIYENLHWFEKKSETNTYYYLSLISNPQLDPQGKPTLSLMVLGESGVLQLTTNWGVNPETIEMLRQYLSDKTKIDVAEIKLKPASITISKASMQLFDEHGQIEQIAVSATSNSPPFNAIFNVQISNKQLALIQAAIYGRKEILKVVYKGSIYTEITIEVSIKGNAGFVQTELASLLNKQWARNRVEKAIKDEHFKIKITTESWDIPEDIIDQALQESINKAAEMLLKLAQDADLRARSDSFLQVSESYTQTINLPVSACTDIGSWFSNQEGSHHIRVVQSPKKREIASPTQLNSLKVEIAPIPEGAPISYIQISQENNFINLIPPNYKSEKLQKFSKNKSLVITTHYTDGSPVFEYSIDNLLSDDLTLDESHIGLIQVLVDGSGLKHKGAKKARVIVRFLPSDNRIPEEQMFYFRGDQWTGSWWLVNPYQKINGVFEYQCKETTKDGNVFQHKTLTAENKKITINYE